ncbi:hypothetical protein M9H77_20616 [Catharanthus roseus]|uniref:Uncharacterized protein n=1 Tax=Catharanthus roseus TaxID=4058 RepID=A0ACC0AMX2_CATRO|nr:hypothetical protein M9H77_20616 [Catharanthus roseus]
MVWPGARSDDDLGAVTDRNGRVERRAVTASSRGVRGCHRLQLGAKFFEQLAGSVPVDSSYSGAEYGATARGISSSDVGLGRDSGTSRSEEAGRVCSLCIHSSEGNEDEREDDDDDDDDSDDDEDDHEPVPVLEASSSGHRPALGKEKGFTGSLMSMMSPADGGPQDPVIIPSYSDHVAGCIWHGQDRGILKSRSRYVSLTRWTPSDPAMDLAGVADSPRSGLSTEQRTACYVLYLLGSSLFTDKSGNNVPDGLHTDPMRFLMYGFLPHPIRPQELCRPANNRVYMVKNVFIEALWLEALSHLLTSTWTSIPTIPPSRCTDDYMPWFLPPTHPWIQNPCRLPCGVQMPTIAPITPQVLLDMVAREFDCDDIDDVTKVSRVSDMIKRYHQTRH